MEVYQLLFNPVGSMVVVRGFAEFLAKNEDCDSQKHQKSIEVALAKVMAPHGQHRRPTQAKQGKQNKCLEACA